MESGGTAAETGNPRLFRFCCRNLPWADSHRCCIGWSGAWTPIAAVPGTVERRPGWTSTFPADYRTQIPGCAGILHQNLFLEASAHKMPPYNGFIPGNRYYKDW